ncbi:MAG: putative Ig domain-containing protein [Terriglobia bacterium]
MADPTRSASASVTIVNPAPSVGSISPTSVNSADSGSTALTVHGAGFTHQSTVWLDGTPLTTSFLSPVQLTAAIEAGQLTHSGNLSLTVVTPPPGGGTSNSATLTVNQPPAITSANGATFTVGAVGSFTVTTAGFPLPVLHTSGTLPSGVAFNASTGVLSGTPATGTGGAYAITFTASNGIGPDAAQSFTLTVNQPPAFTSANSTAFVVGAAGSFIVTAAGFPTPALSESGTLPSGVTFDSSTGVLSGTPAAGAGGTYALTLRASNGVSPESAQDFTLTVNKIDTTRVVMASANPSRLGEPLTFTGTVVPSSGTFVPGGTVQFKVDGTNLGAPVPLSACNPAPNACAVTTTSSLAVTTGSTHSVEAEYSGDGTFNGGVSAAFSQRVDKASTATAITTDLSVPTVVGQTYTVKWSISPTPPGSGTPTGSVTVTGDGTCSATVLTGQCDLIPTAAGVKTLIASYSGDANFNASVSAGVPHPVSKTDTTTAITSDLSMATVVGQAYSVAWTVTLNSPGSGTATGTVTVSDGLASCSGSVAAGQCALTPTTSGTKTITAIYSGDPNANASTSPGTAHSVSMASTTTTITAHTPNPSATNHPITLNFTVNVNAPGGGTVTGNVTVSDGAGDSCVGTVAAGTCQLTPTSAGDKVLTASYASDGNFAASTSAGVGHLSGQPPAITSQNNAAFTVGTAASFTLTATGFPKPTLSQSGLLPSGMTFDAGTGVLSGTPAADTGRIYPIILMASNGLLPDATQNFTITVRQPPVITSPDNLTLAVGSAGSFTVTATGFPTPVLSGSGVLPSGLTFNAGTGVMSGTPSENTGGTYLVTFGASNGVLPNATQGFTITVNQPPAITSAVSTTFTVGTTGSFTVTTTGFPAPTLSESGPLPDGMAFNASTGVLSGIPAANSGGTYPITFTAANGVTPSATQTFSLTIKQPPAITSPDSAKFVVGVARSFNVTASGFPIPTLSGSGALPSGTTFDASTGVLSGIPAATSGGTYPITFTAANGVAPNATQGFTLTVDEPPAFVSPVNAIFTTGTAGEFMVNATGFPAPTLSASGTFPLGVTFDADTRKLSGTPEADSGGVYLLSFTAFNGVGPDAVQAFTLTIHQAPVITSASSTTFAVGTAGSFTVTATGYPTPTLSESGTLPSGVTFVAGTGALAGTPGAGAGGTYPISLTAHNGVGADATQNFTLTVNNPLPTITSISPGVVNFGSARTTLTVTGTGFIPSSQVVVGASSLTPSDASATELTVEVPPSELASPGLLPVAVTNPSPGGGTSTPAINLEVRRVNIWPSAPTLVVNQTQQFTAEVYGAPSQAVTWWVNDVEGGNSTAGTISAAGLYIAPGALPAPNTVFVKAVNAADSSQFGTATTTVALPASDNYPRPGAGSVLRPPGTLVQVPLLAGKSAVAVLDWTTREDAYATQEDLLAVCHVLSPLGIPHDHVGSVPDPAVYPFLAIAGVLDQDYAGGPTALTDTERDALASYVENGGTLFLWLTSDTGVLSRLNLSVTDTHTDPANTFRRPLTFDLTTLDHALGYINYGVTGTPFEEAEVYWQMLYPSGGIPTLGYGLAGAGEELATWDAGGAAVVRSNLSGGRAYVFGWRLRHNLTDGENGVAPDDDLGPPWTNTPRLGADICRLLVRGAYEGWAGTNAQVRQFAPNGKKAALILTHDIDDPTSYELTPTIAALEADWGVKATYNFTTNPYDSGEKETFYDTYGMQQIQQALDLGMDVESHGIGHFPDFNLAPLTLGSKAETAANYFPQYSTDLGQTLGMSVLGEVGVSRWLLENDFGITVEGQRSGFLLVPPDLLQGLKETGYRRDSSTASGVTRGSFPFVAFTVDNLTGIVTTYPIVEYPIAISDDQLPFNSANYDQYLDAWKSVIRANYANNAPTVLLIHPVAEGEDFDGSLRRQAEGEIIEWAATTYTDLWIGDWKTFAEFWEAQGVTCSQWP